MPQTLPRPALLSLLSSTGEVPPPDELERGIRDLEGDDLSRFRIDNTQARVGATSLSLITTSAFRYSGTSRRPPDSLHLMFVLAGSVRMTPPGCETTSYGARETFGVVDLRETTIETLAPLRVLTLRLGLDRLRRLGVRLELDERLLGVDRAAAAPLRAFALAVLEGATRASDDGCGSSVNARVLEELIVGLVLDASTTSSLGAAPDLRSDLRSRAIQHIAAEHHDPALSPSRVARRLGVSLRHLQRAFEGETVSVSRLIVQHRATSAAVMLRGVSTKHLTLEDVASRVGFSSTFELRTAFKSQLGTLPSTYRDAADLDAGRGTWPGVRSADAAGDRAAARVSSAPTILLTEHPTE